ncbi:MAG: hypothetical protein GY694_16315 [Gammaproteobacteria bacterium]|nr:hypothetical protein [Gammaproteobacteria bacterium]
MKLLTVIAIALLLLNSCATTPYEDKTGKKKNKQVIILDPIISPEQENDDMERLD